MYRSILGKIMAIYARRNLIFTNFGPNVLLTQPLQPGQTLVYDPDIGSFVNENNSAASGSVIVVADIPSRDALSPTLGIGALVYVQDTGSGQYALYMWNGSAFITMSTQNSAEADANTIVYDLNYNSPATIVLGNILPGHRAVNITVDVITPFDGAGATLSIGDLQFGPTGLMDTSQNDLATVQDYVTEGTYVYTGTDPVEFLAYYSASGSTVGHAEIIVSYV